MLWLHSHCCKNNLVAFQSCFVTNNPSETSRLVQILQVKKGSRKGGKCRILQENFTKNVSWSFVKWSSVEECINIIDWFNWFPDGRNRLTHTFRYVFVTITQPLRYVLISLITCFHFIPVSATQICTELITLISHAHPHQVTLHVLELVHPPLGVALSNLPEGLVLVPPLLHVLLVDLVHSCLGLELMYNLISNILYFVSRFTWSSLVLAKSSLRLLNWVWSLSFFSASVIRSWNEIQLRLNRSFYNKYLS